MQQALYISKVDVNKSTSIAHFKLTFHMNTLLSSPPAVNKKRPSLLVTKLAIYVYLTGHNSNLNCKNCLLRLIIACTYSVGMSQDSDAIVRIAGERELLQAELVLSYVAHVASRGDLTRQQSHSK